MNLKQSFGPRQLESGAARAEEIALSQPSRKPRRQFEELKVQVLQLAEHQMEISIRVLRMWITQK